MRGVKFRKENIASTRPLMPHFAGREGGKMFNGRNFGRFLFLAAFLGLLAAPKPVAAEPNVALVGTLKLDRYLAGFAWSADGKLLATAESAASEIKLWNAATWKQERAIQQRVGGGGIPLLFTPDGKYLITPSSAMAPTRAAMDVFDMATGAPVQKLEGPNDPVKFPANFPNDMILSKSGRTLYAAFRSPSETSPICAYDVAALNRIDCWPSERGVFTLAAGLGEDEIITSSADGTAQIWDVKRKTIIRRIPVSSSEWLGALAVDPSGKYFATTEGSEGTHLNQKTGQMERVGSKDPFRLWDAKSGRKLASLRTYPDMARIAFSASGKYLVARSVKLGIRYDTFSIYRTAGLKELRALDSSGRAGIGVEFSPDGKFLAVGGSTSVLIYSFDEGK